MGKSAFKEVYHDYFDIFDLSSFDLLNQGVKNCMANNISSQQTVQFIVNSHYD